MFNAKILYRLIITTIICLSLFSVQSFVRAADTGNEVPDAVSIRVMPNPDHFTPLAWYTRFIAKQGSPQSLIVDGYQAIRDGRTVYVGAANTNETSNIFYTNIYMISYSNDAENSTTDIFGQILSNWKFNTNLTELPGSQGICEVDDVLHCSSDAECTGGDVCVVGGFCVKKCMLDSECNSGVYCGSKKARLIRDVERLSSLYEINVAVTDYYTSNGGYPEISDGSYLPDRTISVWSSWNNTFGSMLGYQLPLDPVNRLGKCKTDNIENSKYDVITCWNDKDSEFATDFENPVLPFGSRAFTYILDGEANRYKLCTNFETDYSNLPENYKCDDYIAIASTPGVDIVFGNTDSSEGIYSGYFAVNSFYDVDWDRTEITPINPNTWNTWGGWKWPWRSDDGLALRNTAVENQKKLYAREVELVNNELYSDFTFRLTVYDKYGNSDTKDSVIRICNELTCRDDGVIRCDKTKKRCNYGYLYCEDCPAGMTCEDSVCK